METVAVPAGLEEFGRWAMMAYNRILLDIDRSRYFLAGDVDNVLLDALASWQDKERSDESRVETGEEPSVSAEPMSPVSPTSQTASSKKKKFKHFAGASALTSRKNVFSVAAPAGDASEALKAYAAAVEATWLRSPVRAQLLDDLAQCRVLLRELSSVEGWTECAKSDTTRTYYRKEEGVAAHSFKVSGIVDCELMDLFAVIYEADLYQEWFPFMKTTTELATLSRFHKLVHATINCPWPLTDRDFVLEAVGVDNTEKGRVLINIHSITPDARLRTTVPPPVSAPAAADAPETGAAAPADAAAVTPAPARAEVREVDLSAVLPPPSKAAVRGEFRLGGYMLELLSPTTTRVSFFCNVDPQLALPSSLMNFATSKLVHMIVSYMESAARKTRDPDSRWQERFVRNAQVYADVRDIVESCHAGAAEAAAAAAGTEETAAE